MCSIQEENSELGERAKNNRFRWHNCHWLEIVTGESLYDEEEEEEEDEDYIDILHSAAELDNPDYFSSSPDGPPLAVPLGEMDREEYLLQQYGDPMYSMGGHPFGAAYDDLGSVAPLNSPFLHSTNEPELGESFVENFDPSYHPPRPMSRADNPLASPGMLFDREFDQQIESSGPISAGQLMSSLGDPLALYNSSFKTSLDLDQNFDQEEHEMCSPSHPTTNYTTGYGVFEGEEDGIGQHTGGDSRVGF